MRASLFELQIYLNQLLIKTNISSAKAGFSSTTVNCGGFDPRESSVLLFPSEKKALAREENSNYRSVPQCCHCFLSGDGGINIVKMRPAFSSRSATVP